MSYLSDDEQKRIFGDNLMYYVEASGKNQKDIAIDLDINPTTFNTWCTGKSLPNVPTIQKLASYFHIYMAQLIDERSNKSETYYLDEKTAEMAQKIKDNNELMLLFDAAMDSSPEDLQAVHTMILALKRKERG